MARAAGEVLAGPRPAGIRELRARSLRAVVFAGAALAAAAGLVVALRKAPAQADTALSAIPADTILVVTADIDRMRGSSIFDPLVEQGRELEGVGKLTEVCGFDPVTKLRRVVLAIPSGDEDAVGVVATGAIEATPFVSCASKLIELRGGKPSVEANGSFTTVHDAKGTQTGQIAVRQGGPVILGEGAHLQRMMRAAEGAEPSVLTTSHAKARADIGTGAIVATMVLPEALKKRIGAEMGRDDVPLLRVQSVAASVSVDTAIRLRALVACDANEACDKLAGTLREMRDEAASHLGMRALGLAKPLNRLAVEVKANRLEARLELTREEASSLVDRLSTLRALRRLGPVADEGLPLPPADERIVPPRK